MYFYLFRAEDRMANFHLSEDLLSQYRKAFSVYGKEDDGKISPKDLGVVMRSLGYNPTESELQVLLLWWWCFILLLFNHSSFNIICRIWSMKLMLTEKEQLNSMSFSTWCRNKGIMLKARRRFSRHSGWFLWHFCSFWTWTNCFKGFRRGRLGPSLRNWAARGAHLSGGAADRGGGGRAVQRGRDRRAGDDLLLPHLSGRGPVRG